MPYQLEELDFRNVLDTLPNPCLLIDAESNHIKFGNHLLSEISGYSINEIRDVDFCEIFEELRVETITDGGKEIAILRRCTGEPISVTLNFKFIGRTGKFILVNIILQENHLSPLPDSMSLQILGLLGNHNSFSTINLIESVLEILIGEKFADSIEFYFLHEESSEILERINHQLTSPFPIQIPRIEIERFLGLDVWQPGRRVLSEIHRAARDKKFQCVYTLPVIVSQKPIGIFVFAYYYEPQNELREQSISYLNDITQVIIENSKGYSTLMDKIFQLNIELEKLTNGFEHTSDGILIIDEKTRIFDFNSSFTELLNYSPIELKGKLISQIFGEQESKAIHTLLTQDDALKKSRRISIYDRHGNQRQILLTALPLENENTKKTMLFLRDETDTMRIFDSQNRLEKQAALGETIAEFAHDVRNNINRLSTGIQLLDRKINPSEQIREDLTKLLEDCDNISELMESVLSYSRQDTQHFELITLTEFIQKIIYRNKYKAEKAGVKILFNNRLPAASVLGDQRSLERVLQNLINNAIEAVKDEGGTVSITQMNEDSSPNQVVLKITDTGPGIPDKLSKVLLASQYSDKPSGTGLGLLISRKIIEAHQGCIKLDSFAGGTIFSIYLPLQLQGEVN